MFWNLWQFCFHEYSHQTLNRVSSPQNSRRHGVFELNSCARFCLLQYTHTSNHTHQIWVPLCPRCRLNETLTVTLLIETAPHCMGGFIFFDPQALNWPWNSAQPYPRTTVLLLAFPSTPGDESVNLIKMYLKTPSRSMSTSGTLSMTAVRTARHQSLTPPVACTSWRTLWYETQASPLPARSLELALISLPTAEHWSSWWFSHTVHPAHQGGGHDIESSVQNCTC